MANASSALRGVRLRRGWTEDDVAVRLHQLAGELGDASPGADANQVSKWERGARNPGRFSRPRLCLVFEATPEELGWEPTPRLLEDLGQLRHRLVGPRPQAGCLDRPGRAIPAPSMPGLDPAESERLRAALTRLWPVDGRLVAGLDLASQRLAERRDTEAPSAVMPALQGLLGVLIELISRPQRADHARDLRRIGAFTGQNLAMAAWVAGDAASTCRTYAISESLARESRSGAQLALVLVDRSEMAGQLARATGEWEDARLLSDAAEVAALTDPATPAGVLCWIYGERATQRAMLGNEHGSRHDLERMEEARLAAPAGTINVFSPAVDTGSGWVDVYQVRSALRLGRPDRAIELCDHILATTDRRLVWQVAEALVLLAEAWTRKGELEAAALRLEEAASLTRVTENERDMRVVRRVSGLVRKRWPGAPEVRRLDDVLRVEPS